MLNNDELEQKYNDLQKNFDDLKKLFDDHKHLGNDGSKEFDGDTEMLIKAMQISGAGEVQKSGYTRLPFAISDAHESAFKGSRVISEGLIVKNKDNPGEQVMGTILSGKFFSAEDLQTPNRANWDDINYVFARLIQAVDSVAAGSLPPLSFFVADRTPYITSTGSLSKSGSTLSDSSAQFKTDVLVNCILNVQDSAGNTLESFIITGNTNNVISVNGSWSIDTGTYSYVLVTPVLLGAAEEPWHRVYVSESIRLGQGASGGTQVIWIKHGKGSPEGVVTANKGSIYMREDGGATTSFYVKTSGTGSTGWTAK